MTYKELRAAMVGTRKMLDPAIRPYRWNPQNMLVLASCASATRWAQEHLAWMVQEALTWGPDRAEKLNRWLGFVQGALWVMGRATIEDMRQVNLGAKKPEDGGG